MCAVSARMIYEVGEVGGDVLTKAPTETRYMQTTVRNARLAPIGAD
jgi:hypothetical protein